MNKRLLILAVLIAVPATGSLSSYFYYRMHYHPVKVPVVSHTLTQRSPILADDISYVYLPKEMLSNEIVTDITELKGSYVKTDYTIPNGSFIYRDSLVEGHMRKDNLIYDLKESEVTYDLMTRDISVNSAYLNSDMLCDIYATVRRDKIVSDLLVSDCRIIAMYNVNGIEIGANDKNATVGTITLAIDKESVSYLNKALACGTLRLCVAEDPYAERSCHLAADSAIIEMLD